MTLENPTDQAPGFRRPLVLLCCLMAIFTAAVEATIVATAMPTIVGELGGFALLGWVFAAYMLMQAVSIPIYGRLSDIYGRKRVLFAGTGVFMLASLLCGLAPTMLLLVLARALQGLGAGAIMPLAHTIIADIYSPVERAKVQAHLSAVWGGSAVAGPILGIFIVEHFGWPPIFWLHLPIGAATIIMMMLFYPEKPRKVEHTIDIGGAALLMLSIGGIMLALLQGAQLGWWTAPLVVASVAIFLWLLKLERNAPEPLLPIVLWQNKIIFACNLGAFTVGAAMMTITAFLPTYLQGVMGNGILETGIVLALMSFGWPLSSVFASRLMISRSYRYVTTLGGITIAIGSFMLLALGTTSHVALPAAAAFLVGIGLGLANPAYTVAAQEAATARTRGAATAANSFMRMLGAAVGTAVLGAVLNITLAQRLPGEHDPVQTLMAPDERAALPVAEIARLSEAVTASLHDAFLAGAVIGLIAIYVAFMMPRGIKPGSIIT